MMGDFILDNFKSDKSMTSVPSLRCGNGSLTEDSLERLREIVERQKLLASNGPPTKFDCSLRTDLEEAIEPTLKSPTYNDPFTASNRLCRKVVSGFAPQSYPGFSTNASVRHQHRFSERESTRNRPNQGNHTSRSKSSQRLKRQTAPSKEHSQSTKARMNGEYYNPGSWRVGRDRIREHLKEAMSSDSDTGQESVDSPSAPVVSTLVVDLPSAPEPNSTTPDSKRANYTNSQLKQNRKLKKANSAGVTQDQRERTHNDHHSCCRRLHVTRTDLQDLVRKQREARRAERLKAKQAELERRERIQENLSATAKAASLAAKSPARVLVPKILCQHPSEGPASIPVQDRGWLPATTYSEERAQRLNALLEDELKPPGANPNLVRSRRCVHPLSPRLAPTGRSLKRSDRNHGLDVPAATTRAPPAEETGEPSEKAVRSSDPQVNSSETANLRSPDNQDHFAPCSITATSKFLELATDTTKDEYTLTNHLIPLNPNGSLEDEGASTSSGGDASPPHGERWIRLEAIGASEPEVASDLDSNGDVVDDLLPVEKEIAGLKSYLRFGSHGKTFTGPNSSRSNMDTQSRLRSDLRRQIYADPLRFAAIQKQQRMEALRAAHNRRTGVLSPVPGDPHPPPSLPSQGRKTMQVQTRSSPTSTSIHEVDTESIPIHSNSRKSPPSASTSPQSATQTDFIMHAAQQAISSTPCRDSVHSALSVKQPPVIPPAGITQRPNAAALRLKLSAERNRLELLDTSIQHLAEVDSLRQFAMIRAEAVSLAHSVKFQQTMNVQQSCCNTVIRPGKPLVASVATSPIRFCNSVSDKTKHSVAISQSDNNSASMLSNSKPSDQHYSRPSSESKASCDQPAMDSQLFVKVQNELSNRAATLKLRKERARNLIALTRNLEKEEEKVNRLEMNALKALQKARRQKRLSQAGRTAVNRDESDLQDDGNVEPSGSMHPPSKAATAQNGRSPSSVSSVPELSGLTKAGDHTETVGAQSIASQVSKHSTDPISLRTLPNQEAGDTAVSSRSTSATSTKSTTSNIVNTAASRDPSRQHPHPGRSVTEKQSSRESSSGPTLSSVPSETPVRSERAQEDEQASLSYSQLMDVSAMESRIQALHGELKRQEQLLSRINRLSKHCSTDRLTRLQITLVQHKQLCTEIIQNIKHQLLTCQSSVLSDRSVTKDLQSSSNQLAPAIQQSSEDEVQHSGQISTAMVAEDLVSATDTEGDLQKLDFDDKTATPPASSLPVSSDEPQATGEVSGSEDDTVCLENKTLTASIGTHHKDSSLVEVVSSDKSSHDLTTGGPCEKSDALLSDPTLGGEYRPAIPSHTAAHELVNGCSEVNSGDFTPILHSNVVQIDRNLESPTLDQQQVLAVSLGKVIITESGDNSPRLLTRSPTIQVGPLSDVTSVKQSPVLSISSSSSTTSSADKFPSPVHSPTQTVVDEVTDSLFTKYLSDAVDTVVALNKEKPDPPDQPAPGTKVIRITSDYEIIRPKHDPTEEKAALLRQYLPGYVADVPARTDGLVNEALQVLWDARMKSAPGSREAALRTAAQCPPESFKPVLIDPLDLNPEIQSKTNLRFVNRMLLYDLVVEAMLEIYSGEDAEFHQLSQNPNYRPNVTSAQFRLWNGPTRPQTFEQLASLVHKMVENNLRLRSNWLASDPITAVGTLSRLPRAIPGGNKLSRTAQWTLSKKSFLDAILELELRAEEGSWLSYTTEETQLKISLYEQIWQEMLDEALNAMIQASRGCVTNSVEL